MNIVLDNKTLCDLECIIDGYFCPLTTFMNKKDWFNVCCNMHLENGSFFPLPVTLAVDKETVVLNDIVNLVDNTNYPIAKLEVTEIYLPDIDFECLNAYGTNDDNHPYVLYKNKHRDMVYISGKLTKINNIRNYDYNNLRLKPYQVKNIFNTTGWDNIVGFQTRNPMHRAHYELTKYALNQMNVEEPKLFLNPVVGETQVGDIDYRVRVKCYESILKRYDNNQVLLCLLPLAMRMAGPREACLHAVIRKNYGCTHFIVGRDHAGPSYKTKEGRDFYGPYDAQELLFKYASEIGIIPIVSKMIVYNESRNIYQPIDNVVEGDQILKLSGTQVRNKIKNNEDIPEWFSYPDIVNILRLSIKKRGICYYFIGLSGSGKTTYANILKSKLLENNPSLEITVLDGDIIRNNLSKGLGFSKKDRSINVKRIGYVASEIVKHGGTVICANIAPYDNDRLYNRNIIESTGGKYIEIFVNIPIEKCEERDVKGLYKLARQGKIKEFTGISDPFELPSKPDIIIRDEYFNFDNIIKL